MLSPILPKEEDLAYVPESELIPTSLFERIEEEFRGRIARTSNKEISDLYDKVEKAAKKYEEILKKNLVSVLKSFDEEKGNRARKPALSYDIHNHAIWLLGSVNSKQLQLIHPTDRFGKEVKDRWTTKETEDALKEYKDVVAATYEAIKKILKKASKDLSPHCLAIIHLATFSNLVKTLYLHIKECQPRNWTTNFISGAPEINKISPEIVLEDFFPYWMKYNEAVTNSLTFDGTCLLTGHNMAGKSTLIRSLAATTLLGSSGFMFPAKKLVISQEIDGWYVRTGAGDDPEAGLSAFALEMTDIKVALRDATEKSFLLIDELGKGTESKAGHAIAASVLEHLAQRNIRSIFATHWHEIFVNKSVQLKNIRLIKMLCEGDVPTYKAVDGVDLNSSAFYTALKIGVEKGIVARAEEIAKDYERYAVSNSISFFEENPAEDFLYNIPNNNLKIDSVKEILATTAETDLAQVQHLKENDMPPLNNVGYSIVYVLKTANNFFYVGETDNFLHRVMAHRNRFTGGGCEFFYVTIFEGKSQARQVEQKLITKLKNSGFPMISISDARNLNFGALKEVAGNV